MSDTSQQESYNAADPEKVNEARKRASRKNADRLEMVKAMMGLVEGRAWFYELLVFCHIYETSFVRGASDQTAFREGERNIGNKVLSDIMSAAPEHYLTMMKEAQLKS